VHTRSAGRDQARPALSLYELFTLKNEQNSLWPCSFIRRSLEAQGIDEGQQEADSTLSISKFHEIDFLQINNEFRSRCVCAREPRYRHL